jgi:hypothetical protein
MSSFCNLRSSIWFDFLQILLIGQVHMISLILWEMHILGRNSYYIGILNFFIHFGNRYQ